MNIFTYLKQDHKKVSQLFERIISSPSSSENEGLLSELIKELKLHAETEEATFYRALKKTAKGKELIHHALEEHEDIITAIDNIQQYQPNSPEWFIALGEFKAIVDHHVHEEETEIFKTAKKILTKTRAENLALEMDELKEGVTA